MAQGVGSVLGGPVAALLHQSTGSWIPVFAVIIAMDFTTALLAIAVLKPMRRQWLATIDTRLATAAETLRSRPGPARFDRFSAVVADGLTQRSDSISLHQPPVMLAE
jgi:hypothetical protein